MNNNKIIIADLYPVFDKFLTSDFSKFFRKTELNKVKFPNEFKSPFDMGDCAVSDLNSEINTISLR